jgi:hypothetical protein
MAKAPEALYEARARGGTWLKIKPAVTLDLVVPTASGAMADAPAGPATYTRRGPQAWASL